MYANIQIKKDGSYVVEKYGLPYSISKNNQEEILLLKEYMKENNIVAVQYEEPVYEQLPDITANNIRYQRNRLLDEADVLLSKYNEELYMNNKEANKDYIKAIYEYKKLLRDLPQQEAFPENVKYPELPKYKDYE